jgi:hypothetical protein
MVQIDVKKVLDKGIVQCNLYTGERCVKIFMSEYDYSELMRDGFFIRDGKSLDSANVLNTTEVYKLSKE